MSTPADILRTAAAVIGTHGWIRFALGNETSGFCAMGGVLEAEQLLHASTNDRYQAVQMLHDGLVQRGLMEPESETADWNDMNAEDANEVIGTLLEVADAHA